MSLWELITRSGQRVLDYAADRLQFHLPTDPVPVEWYEIVARNVPLAGSLSAPDRDRLLQIARLLLHEIPFEGCQDIVLNDEIRVTIAATAALLLYRLPYPRFTKLVRVLVYPDTFMPAKAESRRDAMVTESRPTLGQAWMNGVVVLSWAAVQQDTANSNARGNVVLHEMAHILDAEGDPPLDEYAARNTAEFFAVATEAFYCSPDRLRSRLPDLYEQMQKFFRHIPPSQPDLAESGARPASD